MSNLADLLKAPEASLETKDDFFAINSITFCAFGSMNATPESPSRLRNGPLRHSRAILDAAIFSECSLACS